MIPFIVIATLLTLVAGAFILWPLLRGRSSGGHGGAAAVAAFRRTLQELEVERGAGRIGEDAYGAARAVIERQLVEALAGGAAPAAAGPSPALRTALFAAAVVLVVPIALYKTLGAGESLATDAPAGAMAAGGDGQPGDAKAAARPLTNEQVQKMIDRMQEALQKNPADVQGWGELARANAYLRHYPEAVRAFTRALSLIHI